MRNSVRRLFRTPGFTLTALITLALGIGVNTSMFSLLRAVFLRTLPYSEADRLVRVYHTTPQAQSNPHSPANFLDLREQNSVFTQMAALQVLDFNLTEPGQAAERLRGMLVTAEYFPLLGVSPILGRVFTADEDQPGGGRVLVLSHEIWSGRFARDPGIIGREIRIGGQPMTVIGVMPAGFSDPLLFGPVEAWRPMALNDSQRNSRYSNWLTVIARMKPGISLRHAQAEMNTLAARLAQAWPDVNTQRGIRLALLSRGSQIDDNGQITWFVVGLAGVVLLIACANLANLQFARTAARAREHAVRAALGASRARLIREILGESMLLAFAGGALGLLVALWCNDAFGSRLVVPNQGVGLAIPLDVRALGFALLLSGATGIVFGLLPACLASRTNVNDALKQGARGTTAGRAQHRVRHALIVTEIALALVLLASAAFFLGGLKRLMHRDPGWRVDGLLMAYVNIGAPADSSSPERRNAHRAAVTERWEERLARIPGVERVALARALPIWGYSNNARFAIEGRADSPAGLEPLAFTPAVTPGFFETLELRIVQGRGFTPADRAENPLVTVINETMARTLWPGGQSPLGHRIGSTNPNNRIWREVVGVVRDAGRWSLDEVDTPFQMYRPLAQAPEGSLTLALRTRLTPESLAPELRRAAAEIDPSQPVTAISTVRDQIDGSFTNLELGGWSLASFAFLGVLLAALGIYAVIANSVVQRTQEIGIRMALGATRRDVLALVIGQGLRLALIGAAIGIVGAWGVARLLSAIMPAVPLAGVAATASATGLLLAIATFACWLPARRATKVDPMTALRAE